MRILEPFTFFALLQKNVFDGQGWNGREDLRLAIVNWIERTYSAGVAGAASASSPLSSSKPCTRSLMRPGYSQPRESTKAGPFPRLLIVC